MRIYARQSNVAYFYNQASLVICLTNPLLAVETFGLTTLEAMSTGLPVIVPTQGGIAEMVEDGSNGFKIDIQQLIVIEMCIQRILENRTLYLHLSENALRSSTRFDNDTTLLRLIEILNL